MRASLDRIDRCLRAHQGILDACIGGDVDKAAELTRDHILGAGRALTAFLEETRGKDD